MNRSRVESAASRFDEDRDERGRAGALALRRRAMPLGETRLDPDHRADEIDVAPGQIAQLAKPRAGVERGREERAVELALGLREPVDLILVTLALRAFVLLAKDRAVHRLELDRLEDVEDPRVLERHPLRVLGWVARDQLPPLGELEDAVEKNEDLLHRSRRQI